MYKAPAYGDDGSEAGDRELPIWLFDGIVNEHVLYQAVRAYQLNQRQGSGSTKTRAQVRGGGRKPWRQKGTGRARHGSIRSPIWAGGGITFGPKPKSWRMDLPRKVKGLARRSALNVRARDERVFVVDALEFEAPKTRRLRELLESMGAEGKVLLLTHGVKKTVHLSGRNMPHVRVMPFGQESAYDVLWAGTVVIEGPALEEATADAEESGLVEKARARIARAEAAAAEIAEEAPEAAEEEPEAEAAPEPEEEAEEEEEAEPEPAEEEPEPEAAAPAGVDVDEIEIPIVKELAGFLQDFDDVDVIRALQERDDRKTAQRHYEARIDELSGGEDDDG